MDKKSGKISVVVASKIKEGKNWCSIFSISRAIVPICFVCKEPIHIIV